MATPKSVKKQITKYKIRLKRVVKKVAAKNTKATKDASKVKTVKKVVPTKKGKVINKGIIKPNMIIADVIEKYPEAIRVFFEYGITCVGCFLASDETIEQGISAHGLDVKKFLKDLNAVVQDSL